MTTPPGKSKNSDSLLDFDQDAFAPGQIPADLDFDLDLSDTLTPATTPIPGADDTQPDFLATTIRPVGDLPQVSAAAPKARAAVPAATAFDSTSESAAGDLLATQHVRSSAKTPSAAPPPPVAAAPARNSMKPLIAWGLLGLFALLLVGVLASLLLGGGGDEPADTVGVPMERSPSAPVDAPAPTSPLATAIDSPPPAADPSNTPQLNEPESLQPTPPITPAPDETTTAAVPPPTSSQTTPAVPRDKEKSKSKTAPPPPPETPVAVAPPPPVVLTASMLIDRLRDTWVANSMRENLPVKGEKDGCTATIGRTWYLNVQSLSGDNTKIVGTYDSGFESRTQGCGSFLGLGNRRQAAVSGKFSATPGENGRLQFVLEPGGCQGDCKPARELGMVEGGSFVVRRRGGDGTPDQLLMATPEGEYQFLRYRP